MENQEPTTLHPELPGKDWPKQWQDTKAKARAESNWQTIADVDWEDLDFYISNCRRKPNKDDFATAARILAALEKQLLEGK